MQKAIPLALIVLVLSGCLRGYHQRKETPKTETQVIPATQVQPAPAERTLFPMSWNIARSSKDFYHSYAFKNRVIVALFGAESCSPCHAAKDWWQQNGTPKVVPFVYWEDKNVSRPKFEPYEAGEHGAGMYGATHPGAQDEAYPFCSIMEGASRGAPFKQVVKWSGRGYDDCTVGLQQALANLH